MKKNEVQELYSIKRLHCRCLKCNYNFKIDISCDDSLVKFYRKSDNEVRWLHLLSENGYLDLLSKLVKGRKLRDPIDMKSVKLFEKEINKIYEENNSKDRFLLDRGIRVCPSCNSTQIQVINEEIIEKTEMLWLDIKL